MAAKGKTNKGGKGSAKESSKPRKSSPARKKDTAPSQNARVARVLAGLVLAILAVYTFAVLLSYVFTWSKDLSLVTNPEMFDASQGVRNIGGKLGFLWSHFLVGRLFGLAAFAVPFFLGALAVHCLRIRRVNILRVFIFTFFGAILFSILLAFVFGLASKANFLGNGPGGSYGHYISDWLCNMLGPLGAGAVILVALLLWSVLLSRKVAFWFDDLIYSTSHRPARDEAVPEEEQEMDVKVDTYEDDSPNEFAGADGLDELNVQPAATGAVEEEEEDEYGIPPLPEMPDLPSVDDIDVGQMAGSGTPVPVHPDNPGGIIPPDEVELTVDESENDFLGNLSEDERARIYDPRLDLPKYELPPTSLLEDYRDKWYEVSREELEMNKQRIVNALANYKIGVTGINAKVGPTVTLYKIRLAEGIKIAQVRRLEEDIAISLGAKGVRVVTLLDSVGIEVPNEKASVVALKAVLNSPQFKEKEKKMNLPLALGITVTNEPYFVDLTKMPHLLVAGATGMGKSVGLNCILASMLFTKHPAELKLVLVDPKKVELSLYNKLDHHFLAKLPDGDEAIITETKKVVYTLKSLCVEMDDRYELLKEADVRQITEYNEKFLNRRLNPLKGHKFLPYIVVVIDEFADLLVTAGREVEEPIARLAQKARAVGIHLVMATQRPTTDIINGTIKANFNARIAFRVNSMVDSRTIIDSPGANRLIGRGDMLVMAPGEDLVRVQCALVDTDELIRLNKFISDQRGYGGPFLLPEYVDESEEGDGVGEVDLLKRDKLFEEAAKIVVQYQQGSTSLLQRKLNLGYNRAGRIIDQLEAAGIVGPFEGSKARAVLITDFDTLDRKLESLDHQTIL